jgi:hypothetical protein
VENIFGGTSRGTKQMERNLLKEMELVCEDRDTDTEDGQMKDPKEDAEAMAAGFLEDSQIDMDAEQIELGMKLMQALEKDAEDLETRE